MEIKWIQDFLSLAQTSSFSRAAEQRHITQSALSRRIRALEAWLGAELVDRSTLPTRLTVAGQLFQPQAEASLRQWMDTRAILQGVHASQNEPKACASGQNTKL